jgi:predicted site-specific integrase-resolvase
MSKKLNARAVRERYGIGDRTVDYWVERGELPAPKYAGRIRIWDEDELDAHDKARRTKPAPVTRGSAADRQKQAAA